MMTPRTLAWLGLGGLALIFILVFSQVLQMRFSDGDVYPYYATFRNDPLGTSALYESLERMESLELSRNTTSLLTVKGLDGDTALMLIGVPHTSFEKLRAKEDSPVIRAVQDEGARLVLTLNPELVPEFFSPVESEEEQEWMEKRRELQKEIKREEEKKKKAGEDKEAEEEEKKKTKEKIEEFEKRMSGEIGKPLHDLLDVEIADVEKFEKPEEGWETVPVDSIAKEGPPKATPAWFSQYRFGDLGKQWKVVLEVKDKPVVVERKWGKGSVVLASDSYFVSNEALHRGAEVEFLTWLLGGKTRIVFDETIHGSNETGGAMKLMRQYRVHGVFFGLLIFVALWAWRSASFLAPGDEAIERGLVGGGGMVAGAETGSGFVDLLRRSIPSKTILKRCLSTFRSSNHSKLSAKQEGEIEQLVKRHAENPRHFTAPDAYREITAVIRKR